MAIAVIADIVGSRRLADRAVAQRALDEAIARVQDDLAVTVEGFRPTVGDEQQAVYASLEDALCALLLLQLALPDGIECRFGIGVGPIHAVASTGGAIPEGPGWWAARDAIDHVHGLQQRAAPTARTWIVAATGEHDDVDAAVTMANAYLLARDDLVAGMSERARRLTYGRCLSSTQSDLATAEGISQSAVSQALTSSGARSVIAGFHSLRAQGGFPSELSHADHTEDPS